MDELTENQRTETDGKAEQDSASEQPISVVFDSRYKGHIRDAVLEKIRTMLSMIFFAIVLLLIAVYASASLGGSVLLGIILYFVSVVILVSAFFVPLLRKRNYGMIGQIEFTFYPDSKEYEASGRRKHQLYHERSKLVCLHINKRTVRFGKDPTRCYSVPKSFFTCEQIEALTALREKIIKSTEAKPETE